MRTVTIPVTIIPVDTPDTHCWLVTSENEACNEYFMNEDFDSFVEAQSAALRYCRNRGYRIATTVAPTVTDPDHIFYI